MWDVFTAVVCTRIGNSQCKVDCKTLHLHLTADILAAALTLLSREEDSCKIPLAYSKSNELAAILVEIEITPWDNSLAMYLK